MACTQKIIVRNCVFAHRQIRPCLSLNNPKFNYYIDVIYPKELDIKDTTDAPKFDEDGKLFRRLYDKHYGFDFPIVNFPYLGSNISESPAYGVFVSQLHVIHYARVQNVKIFCSDDLFWFQSY